MLEAFKKHVSDLELFTEKDSILLAVSGGVDSMVMTSLFLKAGYKIAMAHCNFKLRGKEATLDEKFVKEFARSENLRFFSKSFLTKIHAREHGISIQMAARDLRYAWLEETRIKHGYTYIATGHHSGDAVETFLINLVRGTGIKGLTGIPPKRDHIIRPLLFADREQIQDYCRENQIGYREDLSNRDLKYKRNRIRHQILPGLEKLNPAFRKNLKETMQRLDWIQQLNQATIQAFRETYVTVESKQISIDLKGLSEENFKQAVLYELLAPFQVPSTMVADILNPSVKKSGRLFFTPSHRLVVDRGRLLVTSYPKGEGPEVLIPSGSYNITSPLPIRFSTMQKDPGYTLLQDPDNACIDLDLLRFPLILRRWKHGDRFFPLGMDQSKKLSDFFTDLKLSLFDKESVWILVSGKDIIWIIGYRIDHRYRITDKTSRILHIQAGIL